MRWVLSLAVLGMITSAFAQQPVAAPDAQVAKAATLRCAAPLARIASLQGQVELRAPGVAAWQAAQLHDALCLNDSLRVGPNSRASLQYAADVTIQLDQNTFVTLIEAKDQASIWTQLARGALHFVTRSRKRFRVITPFANASVEGTEVAIALAPEHVQVTVLEGKLELANDAGRVLLGGGESARVQGLEAIADDAVFRTLSAQAPQRVLLAKPRDTLQWALYYPPIVDLRGAAGALDAAHQRWRDGDTAAAFTALEQVPAASRDAQYFAYRASLLLYVGRSAEAQADLAQALRLDAASKSDVSALQAIMAIVQGDKQRGLSLAQEATAADPASAVAQLALSYARQAHFDLAAALQSARQAAQLAPDNPLAHARVAELRLTVGELDEALRAAQRASELNPNLARTRSVLGFAYLTRLDTQRALAAFAKALQLDSADPLPHLGLGLAKIRDGNLAQGRQDIERAVVLDPNNSLLRSYVGKAYFEERRDALAAEQFAVAKQLDANDPTPWLYDAIAKQASNQPVAAIDSYQAARARNNNRAVVRSNLRLDADQATRRANLAYAYRSLGLANAAAAEGYDALSMDVKDATAHRFVADTYLLDPQLQIARESELLQAKLRQPLEAIRNEANRLSDALANARAYAPLYPGYGEYDALFSAKGHALRFDGLLGNRDTWGDQLYASTLQDGWGAGVGQLHYESDGYRDNNALRRDLYTLLVQAQPAPGTSLQAEYRNTEDVLQDLTLNFDPLNTIPGQRSQVRGQALRLGLRHAASASSEWLASLITSASDTADVTDLSSFDAEERQHIAELQYAYSGRWGHVRIGGGVYRSRLESTNRFLTLNPDTLEPETAVSTFADTLPTRNAYALLSLGKGDAPVTVEAGAVYDDVEGATSHLRDTSPRIGLIVRPTPRLRLRAAYGEGIRRLNFGSATLEPTLVAGFNQLFNDPQNTRYETASAAIDYALNAKVFIGIEGRRRKSETTFFNLALERSEDFARGYLYALPTPSIAIGVEPSYEHLNRDAFITGFELFTDLTTRRLPLHLGFYRGAWQTRLVATYIDQDVTFLDALNQPTPGSTDFWIVDAALRYRLPRRLGEVGLELRNVFDERFRYQEADARALSAVAPRRTVVGRWSLQF